MSDPKDVVRRGYDTLGPRYYEWTTANDPRYRDEHLAELIETLPDGSHLLELGCGPGRPVAVALSERHDYIGVDLSSAQLALARTAAPTARFVQADMANIDFADDSFDAVIAFYSIIHVPRDEQPGLLRRVARWLRPDGSFVANFATGGEADGSDLWIDDVEMFWSSFDVDTSVRMVDDAGFAIERAQVLDNFEDGRIARFLWVQATRRSDGER